MAIEAAHPDFWRKYVGRTGVVVGIASFGEVGPGQRPVCPLLASPPSVQEAVRVLAHRAAHRREQALPDTSCPRRTEHTVGLLPVYRHCNHIHPPLS